VEKRENLKFRKIKDGVGKRKKGGLKSKNESFPMFKS